MPNDKSAGATAPDVLFPDNPSEKKLLGVTAGDFTKLMLGFLFGTLTSAGVAYWNYKTPHITITPPNTIQFVGDKNKYGIVNLAFRNDGSKEAESVECVLKTGGSKAQEVKVAPDTIASAVDIKTDRVLIQVPLLNPGEALQVSVLANDASGLPAQPDVSVRGKGVVGTKEPLQSTEWYWPILKLLTFTFIASMITISMLALAIKTAGRADKSAAKPVSGAEKSPETP